MAYHDPFEGARVFVEGLRGLILLAAFVVLAVRGRTHRLHGRPGWTAILSGLALLAASSLLDAADVELPGEAAFELVSEFAGPAAGTLLLVYGFLRWLHLPSRLSKTEADLRQANAGLEQAVREATRGLRERSRQLEEAGALARIGYWTADAEPRRFWGSAQHNANWGLGAEAGERRLEDILARLPSGDDRRIQEALVAPWEGGEARDFEHRVVWPDGTVHWLHSVGNAEHGPDGQVVRIVGYSQDITERRAAESQRQRIKELEGIAAMKTQFLNNAAHELSTPLTPIKLHLASLRSSLFGTLTPRQEDAVGLLDRNLERLSLIVRDLLDAARLQSEKLTLAKTSVPLGPLAHDTVRSFAEKARQDGLTLVEKGLAQELAVTADPARLSQVLFNLVHNALKFTPRGGLVEVSLATDGADAVLAVRDTGAGLAADQLARLFQPFSQVHDAKASTGGGSGLGLYISKGIVESHGGRLRCRSEGAGTGCTFELRLPLASAPGAELSPVTGASRAAALPL